MTYMTFIEPAVPAPPPKKPPRLAVVENLYHQAGEDQPTSLVTRYSRPLTTPDEVYRRRVDVTTDWQPLPDSWVETPSCLVIQHLGESGDPATGARVELGVAVSVDGRGFVASVAALRPGESLRFEPAAVRSVRLRRPPHPIPVRVLVLMVPN